MKLKMDDFKRISSRNILGLFGLHPRVHKRRKIAVKYLAGAKCELRINAKGPTPCFDFFLLPTKYREKIWGEK